MTDRIAHRGPDAEGYFVDTAIAFGHRRLSIIDLSEAANQPMADHSGRYLIVYNGEFYNYKEIKSRLSDYPFRTDSDSEVILAAYSKWGPACLEKINGMFAFAIWDKQKKELFIARDRLGKKPFYYYQSPDVFVFASEIRSLLASGLVPRSIDEDALSEFLMYQAAMDSHTLVSNVRQLKAGHYAIIRNGLIEETAFWKYSSHITEESREVIQSKVRDLFIDSVRLRLVSDVPIGAFLSGGIDSSLVVACMAELSEQPINTFSISFREQEFDESIFAEEISKKYKTNHHRIVIDPKEFLYSLDEILSAMDSPSGDGPNTYLVAKHTRQTGIKVALSGLGGDELFAGYHKFLLYKRIMEKKWIQSVPMLIRKPLSNLIHAISTDNTKTKAANLLSIRDWNLSTVYPELRRSFSKKETDSMLSSKDISHYMESKLFSIGKSLNGLGDLSKSTIGELETYTRDVLLKDTDQMAMAHALEVRAPFFDYRLVEYVLSIPDKFKYPHTPKKLLVDSLAPRLPDSVVNRKKMGFTFPMDIWLRSDLASFVNESFNYLEERKEFNGHAVRNILTRFSEGDKRILWPRIWQLTVLSDWLQRNNL